MNIKKNYFYQFGYQLLNLLTPLVTIPYLTKVLKADNLGEYTYYFSMISFCMIVGTFGTNIYGAREIARVSENKKELSKKFESIQALRFYSLSITFLLSVLLNVFFIESKIFSILLIMIISLILDISWLYQGIEEFKKVVLRNIFLKVVTLILLFKVVKNENDIYIYTYVMSLSQLFSNLLFWFGLKGIISYRIINLFKGDRLEEDFKKSFLLFLPQITISVYTIVDKLMIGQLVEKKYVSFYEISNKILVMSMIVITSSGTILMPRISNLYEKGSKDEIKKLLKKSFDILTIVAVGMIFGICSVIDEIVESYFTPEYRSIAFLIKVMSITIIFWTWNNITGSQILIPIKRENEITKSVIIGSILNVVLNLFLIKKFYALGAVIATILTECIVTLIQIYYSKEYFRFNLLLFLKSVFSGTVMFVLINQLESLFLKVLVGILVYLTILIIIKEETVLLIIQNLRRKDEKS